MDDKGPDFLAETVRREVALFVSVLLEGRQGKEEGRYGVATQLVQVDNPP